MEVQKRRSGDRAGANRQPKPAPGTGGLDAALVGQRLGEWQKVELRLARSFPECRGVGRAQLEDLYQETMLVLLNRSYNDEEHLRNALRWGIKHRALHLHRDERRRGEILTARAPELQLVAEGRAEEHTPEQAAVLAQDRLIVSEFLSELTELERQVFWLATEGMRYRAIAPMLEVPVNEARKASRACEQKRARFQLLYDTGRLCGFRAHTIKVLKQGGPVTEALMLSAYAHLESCAQCRAEHKTNSRRLRRSFQGQAAALLPIPILTGRLGWLARSITRGRMLLHRLIPYSPAPGGGGVRERAVAMLASGGAAAKVAAGAASVVVIAGSTLGAAHVLHTGGSDHAHRARTARHAAVEARTVTTPARLSHSETAATASGVQMHARSTPRRASAPQQSGFGFLGVPSASSEAPANAHVAASTRRAGSPVAHEPQGETRVAGGAFSP
jgi:RNA polymerase sigma factor (sigma-70 family)